MKSAEVSVIVTAVLAIILLVLVFGSDAIVQYSTKTEVVDTVVRVDRVMNKHGSKWLVTCENEVFQNVDELIFFKFNSSDFNRKLVPGKKLNLVVCGFRVPFLSWYRNIIAVK